MRLTVAFLLVSCCELLRAQAPVIQLQYPAANQAGVPRNAVIFLRATLASSESLKFAVREAGASADLNVSTEISSTDPKNYEVTLRPYPQLSANTSYTVTIAQGGSTSQFTFTTGADLDTTPPHVVAASPAPTSGTAEPWGPFTLQFDELLAGYSAVDAVDGAGYSIGQVSQQVQPDRRTMIVRVTPQYRIPLLVQLRVSARDLIGNVPATPETVTFQTTLGRGLPGPQVIGLSPDDGAREVTTNSAVQLLFDHSILENSLRQGGITLEANGKAVSFTPRLARDTLVVLAGVTLLPSTTYVVRVTEGLLDTNGFAISQPSRYEFTTAAAPVTDPTVQTLAGPAYDSVPPTNTLIVLRSARPMPGFAPLLFPSVTRPSSGMYALQQIPVTASLSADQRTLVLTPKDPLPPHASIGADFAGLTDITGQDLRQSVTFTTGGDADTDPPALIASTPSDGATAVPTSTPLRFQFNDVLSLLTPEQPVRLLQNGDAVAGKTTISSKAIDFVPAQALLADADYSVEVAGVADAAGNVMPTWTATFHTAADSTPPKDSFRLLRSTLDEDNPPGTAALEFQFNRTLRAGHTSATVAISIPRQYDAPAIYPHPFRMEIADDTVRLIPVLPWLSGRDLTVTLSTADMWGFNFYRSFTFRAAPGDSERPEVVSIDPPAGTPIASGQTIAVKFSKPMVDASQLNGGLVFTQGPYTLSSGYWSADRQTLMLPFTAVYTSNGYAAAPVSLVLSSHLTDLAGNALRTVTAVFPVSSVPLPQTPPYSSLLPVIVKSWPSGNTSYSPLLEGHSSIALLLNRPVDASSLNRGLWVLNNEGRVAGTWTTSSGGILATFTPDAPWGNGIGVRLLNFEPTIDLTYGWSASTPAALSPNMVALRCTVPSYQDMPVNAAIEVEFDRALPSGASALTLQTAPSIYSGFQDVPFDETAPSPRVRRLTPRTPLTVGWAVKVALPWNGVSGGQLGMGKLVAPLTDPPATLVGRSPLPGAESVPRNARISLRVSLPLNGLSVNDSAVKVSAGGRLVAVQLSANAMPGALTATPLEPLPANQSIDVTIQGLEDVQGRGIPETSWTFQTGDAFDTTAPRLLYNNLPTSNDGLDPSAVVTATYDEPLDVASGFSGGYGFGGPAITFSADLRTISLTPVGAWPRGMSTSLRGSAPDWAGNDTFQDLTINAGFDVDSRPVSVTAVSPVDGSEGVPINVRFSVLFNKPVGGGALPNARLTRGSDAVPLGDPKSAASGLLTFAPVYPLTPNTEYSLVLDGVRDASGNTVSETRSVRFQTGEEYDVSAPAVAGHTFRPGEPPRLRFAEPLDVASLAAPGSALLTLRNASSSNASEPLGLAWDAGRLELTLTPQHPLDPSISYSLDLTRITDLAGNPVGTVAYTAEDAHANPTVVTFSIPDGSAGVPLNAPLQAFVSRTVTLPPARLLEAGRTVARSAGGATGTLIAFTYTLTASTEYRMEVDSFTDALGNVVPATSSSFTSGVAADYSQLGLVSSVPANNDAGVDPLKPWLFTFNKPLNRNLYFESIPSGVRPIPYRFGWSAAGRDLTVTATPAWPAATAVSWRIPRNTRFGYGVTDWLGLPLLTDIMFTVRTAALDDPVPPVLESATPAAGSTLPGGSASVALRFTKPVMLPTDALQVYAGADKVNFSAVYGADQLTVTVTFAAPVNSRVTLIGTDAIRDNADNPVAPFVLEYATGAPQPSGYPSAKMVEPAPGTPPTTTTVLVRFDRVMQQDSVLSAFRLTQDNENVSGTIDVLEDGQAYRFRPAAPFRAGATVRVFILSTAVDLNGNPFRTSFPPFTSFTIAGGTGSLQLLTRGFGLTAPADSILEAEFDRDLNLASVNEESVWLRRGTQLVGGKALVRDGRVLQFLPNAVLEPGAEYVLTLGAALRSAEGGEFRGMDLPFRASPLEDAAELKSVEATEWMGRSAIQVRFTGPISPVGARGLRLEHNGRPVAAEVFRATTAAEFWIVPRQWDEGGEWTVVLSDVAARNGRSLAPRRAVVRKPGLR